MCIAYDKLEKVNFVAVAYRIRLYRDVCMCSKDKMYETRLGWYSRDSRKQLKEAKPANHAREEQCTWSSARALVFNIIFFFVILISFIGMKILENRVRIFTLCYKRKKKEELLVVCEVLCDWIHVLIDFCTRKQNTCIWLMFFLEKE